MNDPKGIHVLACPCGYIILTVPHYSINEAQPEPPASFWHVQPRSLACGTKNGEVFLSGCCNFCSNEFEVRFPEGPIRDRGVRHRRNIRIWSDEDGRLQHDWDKWKPALIGLHVATFPKEISFPRGNLRQLPINLDDRFKVGNRDDVYVEHFKSPLGKQRLYLNTPEKRMFYLVAQEAHFCLSTFPLDWPDWHADGSPEDFRAWTEMLQEQLDR